MKNKSNNYLLIIGVASFVVPFIVDNFFSGSNLYGSNYLDRVIMDGFNNILRPIIFFILLEPFVFLWNKYIKHKPLLKFFSKEFIDDAIESFFAYWLLLILLFLPGYPVWMWFF